MAEPHDTKRPTGSVNRETSDLASRIAAAQRSREGAEVGGAAARDMTALSRAIRLGSEFIAAILVGTGLGYLIDSLVGTRPWAMLVLLLLGFAAGIVNVTRAVAEMNNAAPVPARSELAPDDEDENDDK
ncbi:hypothetical protein EMQ25_09825 [Arsenicitalea aurantiaca]|uniref:ATP synthase protein I n=1 Tax=Arsenicitalea aurantiaca TaxID=1783274 RepID=A0A433XAX2_9HYPH|nr:AtpZ/AtpI family protein [Arsenicitalea aurantiaca]RUT31158.1 hypothetical protein EMQ25_09825 [Arsenicitalea aurantiaca]